MRRSYISPEYLDSLTYGTFNMVEESNFFSSKMLDIEDIIDINNIDIIWYQNLSNEQLDINLETSINSLYYSPSVDKKDNHKLYIDESQSKYQLERNTKWILDIDLKTIITNYLFAILKKNRTFEGIKNIYTLNNSVDISIKDYINFNVINRYKFKRVDLFISHQNLNSQGLKRYNNNWNPSLPINSLYNKYDFEILPNESAVKIKFEQQSSSIYVFDYFYNILYEKI